MNPVLLYFASGESLYSGTALVVLAVLTGFVHETISLRRLRNVLAWLGLTLIVMSATPLPWAVVGGFFLLFALWYFAWNSRIASRYRVGSAIALIAVAVSICVMEYPFRHLPHLKEPLNNGITIIGDSISAGIDSRVPPWPLLLHQQTGMQVRNLSRAGATTHDAIRIAGQLNEQDHLLLLEIGGNDLISGMPCDQFARSLESLLSHVATNGRMTIMTELPLLPHRIGYGRAQRRLARKYGVYLIPKRYFARVISGSSATLDGLHLSEEGSRRMAHLVAEVTARHETK